jgi:hypothetical protein
MTMAIRRRLTYLLLPLLAMSACVSERMTVSEINAVDERMKTLGGQLAAAGDKAPALCVEYIGLCELGLALCLKPQNAGAYPQFCSALKRRCTQTVSTYCADQQPDGGAPDRWLSR